MVYAISYILYMLYVSMFGWCGRACFVIN